MDKTTAFLQLLEKQPPPARRHLYGRAKNAAQQKASADGLVEDAWELEAKRIAKHMLSLIEFLHKIKVAYLAFPEGPQHTSRRTEPHAAWWSRFENLRWLSDAEKDEVDMRVTQAWKQGKKHAEEIKQAEAVRRERDAPERGVLRMFRSRAHESSAKALAQHRMCVLVTLNDLFFKVSRIHLDLQTRRRDSTKFRNAPSTSHGPSEKLRRNPLAVAAAAVSETDQHIPAALKPRASAGDEALLQQLSPEQIQAFESEEEEQIRAAHLDLERVNAVKTQLIDISGLQSQLIINLTLQSEITDKLYEDALGFTDKVSMGNVQLKKTEKRTSEGQNILMIYLVLASLSLIILDIVA